MKPSVQTLQRFLNLNGADLIDDGIFGELTSSAVNELKMPNYIKIALKEVGVYEAQGSANNPRIIAYHRTTAGRYSEDAVPWCGSFLNWVMLKAGYGITVPYPERAKSWALFGNEQDAPTLGSIAVKSRKGGGHVCVVIGEDMFGNLLCVGGNQHDEVNISTYRRDAFMTFRLPIDQKEVKLSKYNLKASKAGKEA